MLKPLNLLLCLYLYIVLLLSTYQDFFLVNLVGEIGRSGIIILTPVFLTVEILFIYKKKRIMTKLQRTIFLFSTIVFFIGVLYCAVIFLQGSYEVFGESLFLKQLKGYSYLFVIFLYIRHIYFILEKINDCKKISTVLFFTNISLFCFLILEYLQIPNSLTALHSSSDPYYRIRLLTRESSYTSTIWVVYFVLGYYLAMHNSKYARGLYRFTYVLGFLIFLILSGSKGFIISLFITILIIVFINSLTLARKFSLKKYSIQILVIFLGIVFFQAMGSVFIKSLNSDISDYTSLATRLTSVVAAFNLVLHHPFGIGVGNIVYFLPNSLLSSIVIVREFFLNYFNTSLNFDEVYELTKSDYGLSIKSGVLQWMVYGGIISIYFIFKFIRYTFKLTYKNYLLLFINLFVWISLLVFIGFEGKYEIWFWFSFIEWYTLYNLNGRIKDE
ncbi:O-antigen polymerase [Priestia megaterium]|uniref:O-antigen polymerase n=1 Tax=Priestia megaterium TaxID=1404 RepID=UPI000BF5E933|nr:O-antigen polymerase [Priestia megaterium]PFR92339.1 hypothetical protein COK39_20540 [Priestia megaterium]